LQEAAGIQTGGFSFAGTVKSPDKTDVSGQFGRNILKKVHFYSLLLRI